MRLVLAAAVVPFFVVACGGGSNNSTPTPADSTAVGTTATATTPTPIPTPTPASTPTPTPTPKPSGKQVSYFDIQYLQDLNAAPYPATYTDNGVNVAGSLTFGTPGTTVTMTPMSDGGISYGAPIIAGVAISSNASDTNLPAVAMLCPKDPGTGGTGPSSQKSTDVLVASSATRLFSAADLAGKTFNFYREDCYLGGTFPASMVNSITFDASGNASGTDPNGPFQYTAATVTAALNGQAAFTPAQGKYQVFLAYKFSKMDGSTGYAVVSRAAPTQNGVTRGGLAIFTQQ